MSEQEDKSQKTEEPSHRKLEKAKEQGNVFTSKEVNAFLSIFTLSLCILLLGPFFSDSLIHRLTHFITEGIINSTGSFSIFQIMKTLMLSVIPFILFPPVIMMLINILGNLAQHGVIYSIEAIQPKLSRISPIEGFKRIFSFNSVMELLKGMMKIFIVGIIAFIVIKSELKNLTYSYKLSLAGGLQLLMSALLKLFIGICCFMFGLAVIDYIYQRHAYMNKMKMTKKEVKDEHKEQEGSPEIKSKLKAMRAKLSKRRIMAAVPNADVIITNPTHYSVAIEFKPEKMDVPIVVAKGQDEIALMIREIAKTHKIPIVQNPPLARLLFNDVEMGKAIQEKHYKAVAEVIMYVMKLQKKKFKF